MSESGKSSLYALTSDGSSIIFSMPKVVTLFASLTLISFYLNLILGCGYTFTCSSFVPSPHYLGSFLGFNRFYVMSFSLLTITMALMYLGIFLEVSPKCNSFERAVLKWVSILTCICLPIISLTNEVNSTHVLPFTVIYTVLSYGLFGVNIIWLGVVGFKVWNRIGHMKSFGFSFVIALVLLVLWSIIMAQRSLNYKYETWFINTTMWSLFEWIFLTLSILFIPILATISGSFKIAIGVDDDKDVIEEFIELGKFT